MTMYLTPLLTLFCISQIFSSPVPTGNPTCPPCNWTEWFNVNHPNEDPNSGDWETLSNITASGFNVCQTPRDINCRSVRFPYIPSKYLEYNIQCEQSIGLICINKNNEAPCVDFEVQFLCCPCDQVQDSPSRTTPETTSQIPALPTANPTTCPNNQCSWTDWFNTHHVTSGSDGGDFENVTAIINQGYPICIAPQRAECRLVRFPYIPLDELYSKQECSAANGLVCLNKNQENGECLDYEARFLCCTCDTNSNNSVTNDFNTLEHYRNDRQFGYVTDQGSGMSPD